MEKLLLQVARIRFKVLLNGRLIQEIIYEVDALLRRLSLVVGLCGAITSSVS